MTARDDMAVAEYHLVGWGEWRRAESTSLASGYRSKSSGLSTGGRGFDTVDDLAAAEDAKVAQICDTIIWDLPTVSRTMLECRYIFGDVLRSRRPDADAMLVEALRDFWARARRVLG